MSDELDPAAKALLDDLRADPGDIDAAALARVGRRLSPSVTSRELVERSPRRAGGGGARAGLMVALLVGTALGAGGHALVHQVVGNGAPVSERRGSAPPRGSSAVRVGASREGAPTPLTAATEQAAPLVPAANPQPALPRVPASSTAASDLDKELTELEAARRAMAGGEVSRAIAALRRHAQRFPRGALRQERDAMLVKALVAMGSYGEARAAADHFRESYPGSLLADSVERAAAAIP